MADLSAEKKARDDIYCEFVLSKIYISALEFKNEKLVGFPKTSAKVDLHKSNLVKTSLNAFRRFLQKLEEELSISMETIHELKPEIKFVLLKRTLALLLCHWGIQMIYGKWLLSSATKDHKNVFPEIFWLSTHP